MEFKKGSFLLEMQSDDPTDVEDNVLVFPYDKASKYFPSVPSRFSERNVEFSDHLKNRWNMKLSYSHIDREFALTDNWVDFLDRHRLGRKDVIYFSIPSRRLHDRHYLIEYVRRAEIEGNIPEATATYEYHPICEAETMDLRQGEGNRFLFKLPLTNNDITSGKLVIPTKEVKDHFPAGTEIPPEIENLGNLWFVDERNKSWQMKLMFDYQADAYLVTDESMKFVKGHDLKATDVIELYEPVGSLDARHFLIIHHVKSNTAPGGI